MSITDSSELSQCPFSPDAARPIHLSRDPLMYKLPMIKNSLAGILKLTRLAHATSGIEMRYSASGWAG